MRSLVTNSLFYIAHSSTRCGFAGQNLKRSTKHYAFFFVVESTGLNNNLFTLKSQCLYASELLYHVADLWIFLAFIIFSLYCYYSYQNFQYTCHFLFIHSNSMVSSVSWCNEMCFEMFGRFSSLPNILWQTAGGLTVWGKDHNSVILSGQSKFELFLKMILSPNRWSHNMYPQTFWSAFAKILYLAQKLHWGYGFMDFYDSSL